MRGLAALRQGLRALVLIAFAMGSPALGGAFRCCVEGRHAAVQSPDAHAAHGGHHAPANEKGPAPDAPCDCVGACHMADPILLAGRVAAAEASVVTAADLPAPAQTVPRVTRVPYALPFAHAPPSVLS